ncbi:MAG: hypothetical protein ABW219_16095 [Ilumatobacteraceae bacterium]
MSCPLVTSEQQPWDTRKALFSPASLIGGVVLIAFGAIALVGIRPWVGWVVFGVIAASIVGASVVQWRAGHRGWCLVRRASWFGLTLPGAPLRLLGSAP